MTRIPKDVWKHGLMDVAKRARKEREREQSPIEKDPYAEAREEGKRQVPLYQAMLTTREKRLRNANRAYQEAEARMCRRMQEIKEMRDGDD